MSLIEYLREVLSIWIWESTQGGFITDRPGRCWFNFSVQRKNKSFLVSELPHFLRLLFDLGPTSLLESSVMIFWGLVWSRFLRIVLGACLHFRWSESQTNMHELTFLNIPRHLIPFPRWPIDGLIHGVRQFFLSDSATPFTYSMILIFP